VQQLVITFSVLQRQSGLWEIWGNPPRLTNGNWAATGIKAKYASLPCCEPANVRGEDQGLGKCQEKDLARMPLPLLADTCPVLSPKMDEPSFVLVQYPLSLTVASRSSSIYLLSSPTSRICKLIASHLSTWPSGYSWSRTNRNSRSNPNAENHKNPLQSEVHATTQVGILNEIPQCHGNP